MGVGRARGANCDKSLEQIGSTRTGCDVGSKMTQKATVVSVAYCVNWYGRTDTTFTRCLTSEAKPLYSFHRTTRAVAFSGENIGRK